MDPMFVTLVVPLAVALALTEWLLSGRASLRPRPRGRK